MTGGRIEFGPFVLDRDSRALLREGDAVAIGQRGLALLEALVDASGATVSKGVLMEKVWPGTFVEESNLSVQIASLRKALGTRDDGSDWIVTVPRVGYRLVRGAGNSHDEAAGGSRLPSLAVRPFQNLSDDPSQDYFADGVVEDIVTGLGRFRTISVVARNSSFVYKGRTVDARQIAEELGVRYLVQGSLRKSGDRLRITAQLVDASSGAQLWARAYDGAPEDVFAFQDGITESVVSIVEPTIKRAEIERLRRKPPTNLDAYDLYLQALEADESARAEDFDRALELIERSLTLDPHFAPAIAVAINQYITLFDQQRPSYSDATRKRGLEYAHRALQLAGDNAIVRAIAALGVIQLGEEYEVGMSAARQAARDNPNSADVLTYAGVAAIWAGDLADAESYLQRAIRLNSHDISAQWLFTGMAHVRTAQGRYAEALEFASHSYSIDPANAITHWMLIAATAHLGRLEEAWRWRDKLLELAPEASLARIRRGQRPRDAHRIEIVLEGMRLAGMPET
jgi:TolB-like protein/Tfp pilus assembly protein PilF